MHYIWDMEMKSDGTLIIKPVDKKSGKAFKKAIKTRNKICLKYMIGDFQLIKTK